MADRPREQVRQAELIQVLEGEVLLRTSGKAGFLPQVVFTEAEGVDAVLAEAREEHDARDAG